MLGVPESQLNWRQPLSRNHASPPVPSNEVGGCGVGAATVVNKAGNREREGLGGEGRVGERTGITCYVLLTTDY